MIRHVVMFRFRNDVSEKKRTAAFEAFRNGILSLKEIIPQIKNIEVGRNINVNECWDICLSGLFADMDDVNKYASHPRHVEIAGALKELLAGRACTDYETDED